MTKLISLSKYTVIIEKMYKITINWFLYLFSSELAYIQILLCTPTLKFATPTP